MSKTKLMLGDNIQSLQKLPEKSVDSIVTDPPYGLSFMGKKWDYDVPSVEFWKEVYRVLKPGGHVLSFGGTRTYHRMVVNIEDAGFEIRDQIQWLYGSGFPKSHNIGKAVDRIEGNEREVVGTSNNINFDNKKEGDKSFYDNAWNSSDVSRKDVEITKGQSKYEGWGTALKPANEPICVARKPLSEKSVAENVLKWGTGGINIDGCRIEGKTKDIVAGDRHNGTHEYGFKDASWEGNSEGRFPANIIFDESAAELLDLQSGVSTTKSNLNYKHNKTESDSDVFQSRGTYTPRDDKGGASRFFYVAKVSKKERNLGLDDKTSQLNSGGIGRKTSVEKRLDTNGENAPTQKNTHPTLKPINLMTYLCRLVTPEGGIVLDPFMGSGSTGIAARLEGFRFLGMEMDKDYFKIAEARIESYEQYRDLLK